MGLAGKINLQRIESSASVQILILIVIMNQSQYLDMGK